MTITVSDITSGYRTTIPKEIRKKFGVEEGMQAVWYVENEKLKVYFRKVVKSIGELKGTVRGGRDLSKISAESFIDEEYA